MARTTQDRASVLDEIRDTETSISRMSAFARTLKAYRDEHDLTLTAVADQTGISPSTLSRIENGKLVPKFQTMARLCDLMDVSIEDFTEHRGGGEERETMEQVAVHLRADRKLSTKAAQQIIDVVKALYAQHAKNDA